MSPVRDIPNMLSAASGQRTEAVLKRSEYPAKVQYGEVAYHPVLKRKTLSVWRYQIHFRYCYNIYSYLLMACAYIAQWTLVLTH